MKRASFFRPFTLSPSHPLARICRVGAALELPLLVASAPAMLFPTPRRLVMLAFLPAVWFCLWATGAPIVPRTPFNAALSVLLVMVGVSVWTTFDPLLSLGKICGVVFGVLLFWATVRQLETPARLQHGVALFIVAGAGLAVVGLLGTNWVAKFPVAGGLAERLPKVIRGLPGAEEGFSPNALGGSLVLFVPLQAVLLAGAARARAALAWPYLGAGWQAALFLLTAGTLVLTQSRGAWTGLAVAALVLVALSVRWVRVVAAAAVAAAGVGTFWLGPHRALELLFGGGPLPSNVAIRLELWSRAIDAIRDVPFTGLGLNAFRQVMPALYPSLLTSPDADIVHAHNQLLQTALDVGLPGLAAYVAIWIVAAGLLARIARHAAEPWRRAVAAGLGAGLVAQFVFGVADAIPLGAKVGVLFWLALALVAGLHGLSGAAAGQRVSVSDDRKDHTRA